MAVLPKPDDVYVGAMFKVLIPPNDQRTGTQSETLQMDDIIVIGDYEHHAQGWLADESSWATGGGIIYRTFFNSVAWVPYRLVRAVSHEEFQTRTQRFVATLMGGI
jgi:hypothetical protein